jgi:hypothetical protein
MRWRFGFVKELAFSRRWPGAKTRAWLEKSRLKGGCSQDWLPHNLDNIGNS